MTTTILEKKSTRIGQVTAFQRPLPRHNHRHITLEKEVPEIFQLLWLNIKGQLYERCRIVKSCLVEEKTGRA